MGCCGGAIAIPTAGRITGSAMNNAEMICFNLSADREMAILSLKSLGDVKVSALLRKRSIVSVLVGFRQQTDRRRTIYCEMRDLPHFYSGTDQSSDCRSLYMRLGMGILVYSCPKARAKHSPRPGKPEFGLTQTSGKIFGLAQPDPVLPQVCFRVDHLVLIATFCTVF